jgi:hypothetical protein
MTVNYDRNLSIVQATGGKTRQWRFPFFSLRKNNIYKQTH